LKIAVELDKNGSIGDVNMTNENAALEQSKIEGWTLVDSISTFSIETKYLWTVRQTDNKLVHISTGMTPDEETANANALLGKNVGQAIVTATTADKKANNAINSSAQLGKLMAPVLAEYEARQNTSNTTGGTK